MPVASCSAPGAPRREGTADLMPGEHPAVDERTPLAPEGLDADRDRRWHRGDPVQAVEHHEPRQVAALAGERRVEHEQRQTAQQVVRDEQLARVDPVREPSTADRADDVEHADQRQVATCGGVADAVVVRRRDEVGLDEPGRRQSAHEEAAPQEPEDPAGPRHSQGVECGRDRAPGDHDGRCGRIVRPRAVGGEADVLGPVAQEDGDDRDDPERAQPGGDTDPSPARSVRQPR